LGRSQNKYRNCKGIKHNPSFVQNTALQDKFDTICEYNVTLLRLIKIYTPKGKRNQGRPPKRLLDATSGPNPGIAT
jgi:hypothetical protein